MASIDLQSLSTQQTSSSQPGSDPFHGHEHMARLAGRFVAHLFACPDQPRSTSDQPTSATDQPAPLDYFIAYAMCRTRFPESVTYASLFLLQRLKARFPAAKGSSGHRLFISAFMLVSKIMCDDNYSNKSWCEVAQGMFALREVNQMEREMCSYLEWHLLVDHNALQDFTARVQYDFSGPGPYPALGVPSEKSSPPDDNSNLAAFGQSGIYDPAPATEQWSAVSSASPPTPEGSSSASVSPASVIMPVTPPDFVPGYHVGMSHSQPEPEYFDPSTHDPYMDSEQAGDRANAILGAPGSRKFMPSPTMRSKPQVGRGMYAYITRTIW